MRILILNYEYPPLGGGAGVCSAYHAQGLAALGHEVCVLTTWYAGCPETETLNNLVIQRLHARRRFLHKSNPLEMYAWVRAAHRFLKKAERPLPYDVVLANFAIPGGLVARRLQQRCGIPYVIISHGQDIPWFFPRQMAIYHFVLYPVIRAILRHSLRNVLLTESMKAAADRMLPKTQRTKNVVIRNGCDTRRFVPVPARKSAEFTLLFAGRLRQQKDPFTFLQALHLLNDRSIPFRAVILGDGPLRKRLETRISKLKLNDLVHIAGWQDKEAMLQAYQSASLLVSTSREEGMSIAILEALSTGLYTIATPASGNPEMIREKQNGTLIPFRDARKTADAIEEYYHHSFLKGSLMPAETLDTFRHYYDWNKVVDDYHQLLTHVIYEDTAPH